MEKTKRQGQKADQWSRGWDEGRGLTTKGQEETFWVTVMFHILTMVEVS